MSHVWKCFDNNLKKSGLIQGLKIIKNAQQQKHTGDFRCLLHDLCMYATLMKVDSFLNTLNSLLELISWNSRSYWIFVIRPDSSKLYRIVTEYPFNLDLRHAGSQFWFQIHTTWDEAWPKKTIVNKSQSANHCFLRFF